MKHTYLINPILYKVLFVLSVGVLLIMASLNYQHNEKIAGASEKVLHIHKVNCELENINSLLKDGQRGIDGFIITNDASLLKPYLNSRKQVDVAFKTLKTLLTANVVQQENLKSLLFLIDNKFKNYKQTLQIQSNTDYNKNKLISEKIKLDNTIMDDIIKISQKMIARENSYLLQRTSIYNYQLFLNPIFAIATVITTLILLVFSYVKIDGDIRVLKESNDNLLFLKTSNDQSEILGKYSSWLWNLDTNAMTFSDNQYRLLGFKPQSFKANTTNFIKSVHPEDKYLVENIINKIIVDEDLPTIYYRVLTKNNEIRHFKSNGTLITDRFKNKIIVGNTRDISDEKMAKLDIEVRNMELEQSNNELISFNYVASHDLQEPLRKIQTFISRFSELDIKNLSQNGKGYFLKIEAAIVKMRELIDDLLLYSKTSKAEKKFELFDLNETLECTKQELSQIIKDSRATISSNTMPTLKIITFQMQQLFVNIIINSIKYAKKNVPAIIQIECTKINAIDYPILTKPVSEEYYEISFADNGIGFDEQYADKVFILFNRLISDDDYQGSGIGLTICKKIAENHLGHLAAHSSVNDGSTFTLYLPILK